MTEGDEQRSIGRIEGKLDSLMTAFKDHSDAADQSRRRLYERVGKIETSIEISGQVDAQVRDRLDRIDLRIEADVMPTVNKVNGWEKMGMGALAIIGIGGAAFGAGMIFIFQNIRWPWQL